jgi:ParB-like chromosome segregation protein Spo0J
MLVGSAACGRGVLTLVRRVQSSVGRMVRSEEFRREAVGTDLKRERPLRRRHVTRGNESPQDERQQQQTLDSAASAAAQNRGSHEAFRTAG